MLDKKMADDFVSAVNPEFYAQACFRAGAHLTFGQHSIREYVVYEEPYRRGRSGPGKKLQGAKS